MVKKGFSPEARLKGIKKQAAGLGYELVPMSGGARASPSVSGGMDPDVEARARKVIAKWDSEGF